METVKVTIRNKKTGATTDVKASIADDFVGTGDFELVEKEEKVKKTFNTDNSNKE